MTARAQENRLHARGPFTDASFSCAVIESRDIAQLGALKISRGWRVVDQFMKIMKNSNNEP